jgi:hypothetical protein
MTECSPFKICLSFRFGLKKANFKSNARLPVDSAANNVLYIGVDLAPIWLARLGIGERILLRIKSSPTCYPPPSVIASIVGLYRRPQYAQTRW